MTTHYQRLGVAPDATTAEIRRSWLRLAREHHPDFHVDAAATTRAANEREMQAINDAWAVLGDPDRRRVYDLSLGSTGAAAHEPEPFVFVPYDDGDDPIDPRLLDDTGVAGTEVGRSVQMLPVVLLVGGVVGVVLGVVIDLLFLIAVGLIGLVGAGVSFLIAPLMAVSRSIAAERRR